MIGKLNEYMGFNEAALGLRAQRQQLLASNIANADTPNYKARDIDFASALQAVVARNSGTPPAGALAKTDPAHLPVSGGGDYLPNGTPVLYRMPTQGAADNNTVEMDTERSQFADNAIRYEAGVTFLNMQIRTMMGALQGGS